MRILGNLMLHAKNPLYASNCIFSIHMPISSCLVYWLVCIKSSDWLRFYSGPRICAHLCINRNRMAISSQQCHQIPEIQGVPKKKSLSEPAGPCSWFRNQVCGEQLHTCNCSPYTRNSRFTGYNKQTWFLNHEQGPADSERAFFWTL